MSVSRSTPSTAPPTPDKADLERLADDVRYGIARSDYARGFNDGIDAFIARLIEEVVRDD